MGLLELGPLQYEIVELMTNIYKDETYVKLYGEQEAKRLRSLRVQELVCQLGKGSGKDYLTAIAFCRIVYLLLCLKDPADYYGKPAGDSIALLNVAVNSDQAQNVFFKYLKTRVARCPWFNGRYAPPKVNTIDFDKNISCYSGHSEREAWEGYNFIAVVLDEIAGYATSGESTATDRVDGKTADAIYKMYRASVSSRFKQYGKLVLLSFPRAKMDFIQKRYEEVISSKTTEIRRHVFKIHEDGEDIPENQLIVEWDYDTILEYREPGVYAIKRATWEVNPTSSIEDFKSDFYRDMEDSLGRFACMPPEVEDAYYKDRNKVWIAFPENEPGPFDDAWGFRQWFRPDKDINYYMHVDLAHSHDRAVIALAHCDEWVHVKYLDYEAMAPVVKIDAVRTWTPGPNKKIIFKDLQDYIYTIRNGGFRLKLVTFDRWNSVEMRQELDTAHIENDLLSVGLTHYNDFTLALNEQRVKGYDLPLFRDEFLQLRIVRTAQTAKIDHKRRGSKDVADGVVGAVYNVLQGEKSPVKRLIEVRLLEPEGPKPEERPDHDKPKAKMPKDLQAFIERMTTV